MVSSGVRGDMRSTRSRTATAVVAIIGMLAVAVVTVFFELLAMGLGTCGGDGGSPYAARDSAQGHLCDFLDRGGMTLVVAVEVAALVAAGVVLALWARRRAGGRLAVTCAVAAAFLPLAGLWALSAPSDECSKADQAAYRAWLDRGASGKPPPADCDSY
jgi:hypothetical protein